MSALKISFFTTTFPKASESFLQREVALLSEWIEDFELISIHRGKPEWHGHKVTCFSKWRLLTLAGWIPYWFVRRPAAMIMTLRDLVRHPCPSLLNFQETMLGLAYALCTARAREEQPMSWSHAAWATMPATAVLLHSRLLDRPFSMEGHAYDLFQWGGDWLLEPKLREAAWIRTSTFAGFERLLELGASPENVLVARRGLPRIPALTPPPRIDGEIFRLISAGRFVPKKGLMHTLRIAAALRDQGLRFHLEMIGDGPLRAELEAETKRLHLSDLVSFPGFLDAAEFQTHLQSAHCLLFCGETARDGDRDGLPNVIPEAMAHGVLVLSTPTGATTEAIIDRETGFLLPIQEPLAWAGALQEIQNHPDLAEKIRAGAYQWVVTNYDCRINLRPLSAALKTGSLP